MNEAVVNLLQRVDPTVFVTLALVFGFAFGTAIISSVICQIGKFRKREQELEFKREMLLHGVPAEEIERTLAAPLKSTEDNRPIYNGNIVIHQTEPYQPAERQAEAQQAAR
jgi:hypothetical protein